MIVVSKILGSLLLPSSLGCIALLAAWLLFYRKPLLSRSLLGFALIGLYLLSLQPVAALLAQGLQQSASGSGTTCSHRPSVIVVLAGGADRGALPGELIQLSGSSWRRLVRAVSLYRSQGAIMPILYSGDNADPFQSMRHEGEAAKAVAASLGVSAGDFWVEGNSRTTWESAYAVRSMLEERRPGERERAVFLVTSAWHLPRALEMFQRVGICAESVPADFFSTDISIDPIRLIPSAEAYAASATLLREWIGRVEYWIVARFWG